MDKPIVRIALQTDKPAIQELNTRAFGQEDEARIIRELEVDGDVMLQLVAVMEDRIVGHLLFYAIGVRDKIGAVGLGPMSVDPWVQREGVGTAMVNAGLVMIRDAGAPIVFVLGHDTYYPRFGFSVEATAEFQSIYKGPHFVALRFRQGPPMSGELIFPRAFGEPRA